MTPQEEALFRHARSKVPSGTVLKTVVDDDERSVEIAQFCERLQEIIPQISILREENGGAEPPLMLLPGSVRYHGIPQANEVPPFIDALAGTLPPLADSLRKRLHSLDSPAVLELFVTPHCTFCPAAVRRLIPLALSHPLIRLSIIDGLMYPELASRNAVQSVPTLIVDGQYRWTVSMELDEIAAWIGERDPVVLTPTALETMLKQGSAKELARLMAERNAFFPALLELLCHEQWPVRLGAMVAVEELNALRPDLARQAIDPLWARLRALPDTIQGDLFYVFGEIGGPEVIPQLTFFLQGGASADVRDAVQEALEKLKQ